MNNNRKKVYGVGFNDADYVVQKWKTIGYDPEGKQLLKLIWKCPYYSRWKDMLGRCYSSKVQKKYPTYKDCLVCDDWLYFSKFKAWMETQDWDGKVLDKDILVEGNKLYSPERCCFVSVQINSFLTDSGRVRGKYKLGVTLTKEGKFKARVSSSGQEKALGTFETEDEAYSAWLSEKINLAKSLASNIQDERVAKALILRYGRLLGDTYEEK